MSTVKEVRHFIDNEYVGSSAYLDNVNPATNKVFSKLARGGVTEIEMAVAAAEAALPMWSLTPVKARSRFLYLIADLVEKRSDDFARAESEDQGKPVHLAMNMDIRRVIENFRFFAGAVLHHEEMGTEMDAESFNYVRRRPLGVCGLISPWNLPLYLLSWKIAPAIATGNTVVCKPSEFTSMTAHLLTEVLVEAKLPKGVVNIVYGLGPEAGEALVTHPRVPLISFTGGTATGKHLIRASAAETKKLSLELGGKNPNIIFADCDFEEALRMSIRSSFLNQGEICLCGSRIYVEDSLHDKFVAAFVAETKKLKVGDPSSPETFMGPLVSKAHYDKVLSFLETARQEGGQILTGGGPARPGGAFDEGFFVAPTVIAGLPESSTCVQEEIFGPVVTLAKFSSLEDVIEKANGVRYGLSASVWTRDLSKAHRMAASLKVGTVWINTWLHRDLRVPFGGQKASGMGREGGRHSIEFFTEVTNVCVRY